MAHCSSQVIYIFIFFIYLKTYFMFRTAISHMKGRTSRIYSFIDTLYLPICVSSTHTQRSPECMSFISLVTSLTGSL